MTGVVPASSTLPLYSESLPPPAYSNSPLFDEQTLRYSPRSGSYTSPSGTYSQRTKEIALLLTEQENDASRPTYDGLSFISGIITLANREDVSQIEVKVGIYIS